MESTDLFRIFAKNFVMIELQGKYNVAKVFTDNIEETAVSQVLALCDLEAFKSSKICIMPDVHAGKGATVGTTMTLTDKVIPAGVGADIGCGMLVVKINTKADSIDLAKLDGVIKEFVPLGFNIRAIPYLKYWNQIKDEMDALVSLGSIDLVRAKLSIGTLGQGNHFLELDVDVEGNVYLVIHTGSRNVGAQVAVHYQNLAYKSLLSCVKDKNALITELRAMGREKDIANELKKLPPIRVSKDVAYVEGKNFDDYIHDMRVMQKYADLNRKAIANTIISAMHWTVVDQFTTIHNYIDLENMILRKGAISAQVGERVLIPMNNEDGSLICIGKGNADWNYSAPHGAGRRMSRSKAKATLSVDHYKEGLKKAGVYTTTANQSTVDESKEAYKPMEEIVANIGETVDVVMRIKPIYNIKAGDED